MSRGNGRKLGGSLIWIESDIFQPRMHGEGYTQSSFISRCVIAYWSGVHDIPRFPRGQKFHKGVHTGSIITLRGRGSKRVSDRAF